jgi:hypothetical protein
VPVVLLGGGGGGATGGGAPVVVPMPVFAAVCAAAVGTRYCVSHFFRNTRPNTEE